MVPDHYRVRKEKRIRPCHCHGYAFPHARARGWCVHNPKEPPEGTQAQREPWMKAELEAVECPCPF